VLVDSSWDSATDAREFAEAIQPLLEKKNAKNVRVAMIGPRVLAAWGPDVEKIRKFVASEKPKERK
jgi:hypothetical protein